MNILFLSRLFYPHIGGVEKHVMEISKILIQEGHKVTVICEKHDTGALTEKKDDIKIYRISVGENNWFKKFRIWIELWDHLNLIKEADIIHCHDVFFWYLPFRFLFPFKKVFTTFHGYEGYPLKQKNILIHKISEKLSMGNICVGDYIKKWYGTVPNYVIYGAINVIKKENKSKYKDKYIRITYVGRLEEEAGIMIYLKVLKILKNKGYNVKLIILGDGIQREKAEQFCRENNLEVNFKGFVKDVYHYLSDSDFVFTSRFLSTMEALNAKKFTFVAQTSEINNDCFALSPFLNFISLNEDERKLVESFTYYLNNKNLMYDKIRNGYNWIRKQTWENVAQLYLSLWKS